MESKICVCADAVRSGRAVLLIHRRNDYEKHVHAGQRRACVGHLAHSSRPQTISAVWERDQRPAEKWSSRTGDAASVLPQDFTQSVTHYTTRLSFSISHNRMSPSVSAGGTVAGPRSHTLFTQKMAVFTHTVL